MRPTAVSSGRGAITRLQALLRAAEKKMTHIRVWPPPGRLPIGRSHRAGASPL
jgi:hypothetical protein